MNEIIQMPGFAPPIERGRGHEYRTVAELIATAALALSTVLVAIVLSVGMARATPAGASIDDAGSVVAVALLLGLVFAGTVAVTALTRSAGRSRRR